MCFRVDAMKFLILIPFFYSNFLHAEWEIPEDRVRKCESRAIEKYGSLFNKKTAEGYFCAAWGVSNDYKQILADEACQKFNVTLSKPGTSEFFFAFDIESYAVYKFSCKLTPAQNEDSLKAKKKLELLNQEKAREAQLRKQDEKIKKINALKKQCEELGYPQESDKFKKCVLELVN